MSSPWVEEKLTELRETSFVQPGQEAAFQTYHEECRAKFRLIEEDSDTPENRAYRAWWVARRVEERERLAEMEAAWESHTEFANR